jgi:uncharacterized protein with PQ loop repeat
MVRKMKGYSFKISLVLGVAAGSILLPIFRMFSMPITGLILAFTVAGFVTSFLFLPENNDKTFKRKASAGAAAAVIIGLMISFVFYLYYIFYLRVSIIPSASSDLNMAVYVSVMLIITVFGGFVLGNLGGAIGAILGDTVDAISKKR